MELKDILQYAGQGGVPIIVFIIWYFTFKEARKQTSEAITTAKDAVESSNGAAKEAFRKHAELSSMLIQLLRDEQEYKTLLTGILSRLEAKMGHYAICPLVERRRIREEGQNE